MAARKVLVLLLVTLAMSAAGCINRYRTGAGYGGSPGIAPSAYEHYIRGRLAADQGDHVTAIAELRMASASAPDQPEPRIAVGEELLAAGRMDDARAEAGDAIGKWPSDPRAWRLVGRVRGAWGDGPGAAEAFERSLAIDSSSESSWLMLAAAYRQARDERRALTAYRRMVAA